MRLLSWIAKLVATGPTIYQNVNGIAPAYESQGLWFSADANYGEAQTRSHSGREPMEAEGVIKYRLRHRASPPLPWETIAELDGWRGILHRIGLIGQDPGRYGGVGFGNVSRRLGDGRFLITGSQTGHLATLGAQHYVTVERCDIAANTIQSHGPLPPSSEAMTHAACYAASPAIGWVMHVHCPELWRNASRLDLPVTPPEIGYGTPEMAEAVARLAGHHPLPLLVAMGGHEDGIIACGATAAETGCVLIRALADAQSPSQTLHRTSPGMDGKGHE